FAGKPSLPHSVTGPAGLSPGDGTVYAPPNDNATRGGDLPDNGQGARARRRAASTTEARRRACSSSVGAPVSMRATCGAADHHPASERTRKNRWPASIEVVIAPCTCPSDMARDLYS